MFKEIKDTNKISFDDAEKKYKGYMILMLDEGNDEGTVYAIADGKDRGEISRLQLEFHKKGIETIQLNELSGNNSTLITRKTEIL